MYIHTLPRFSLRPPIERPAGWKYLSATKSVWLGGRIADYGAIPSGMGVKWVDHSTISRSSVKPRRARAGDVLDSERDQVGESATRLRMPTEGHV